MALEVVGNRRSVLPRGVHGAADPHFACAVRSFASTFHGSRFGGGAFAVYLDGEPVVDVWTGYADRPIPAASSCSPATPERASPRARGSARRRTAV